MKASKSGRLPPQPLWAFSFWPEAGICCWVWGFGVLGFWGSGLIGFIGFRV